MLALQKGGHSVTCDDISSQNRNVQIILLLFLVTNNADKVQIIIKSNKTRFATPATKCFTIN